MRAISKHKAVSTNMILAFFSTRIQKYQDLYISILSDAGDEPLDKCFFFSSFQTKIINVMLVLPFAKSPS